MLSVLETLRARTRTLHSALESRFDLSSRIESRDAYVSLLERYLGIYRPFELGMDRQPTATLQLLNWGGQRWVARLENDLQALGVTPAERSALPECQTLPVLRDLDSVLGAMYVVEGSALGAQLIYRQIEGGLGLSRESGAEFFYGDGASTGAVWKSFTTLLEQHVKNPERAAESACNMFSAFDGWLNSLIR